MKLTNENYFSQEANQEYLSASQFKDFAKCEVEALAKINGELVEEKTKALLVGGYVDAHFSNELDKYKEENPEIFKKDGTLLKDFVQAEEIIKAIEKDFLMMHYLNGEKQVIMTGEIAGVPYKIKVDALHEDKIVDQKVMASIQDRVWVERNGRNVPTDFVDAYGYDIQGAIYQEIVRQNTGKKLPFILAIATKEDGVDKELIEIDQEYLDRALALVERLSPRYQDIKQGKIKPVGCGKCKTCREKKVLTELKSYKDFFGKEEEQE